MPIISWPPNERSVVEMHRKNRHRTCGYGSLLPTRTVPLALDKYTASHKSSTDQGLLNIPGRIRTFNLWLRRPTLYPIELRGRDPDDYNPCKYLSQSQTGFVFQTWVHRHKGTEAERTRVKTNLISFVPVCLCHFDPLGNWVLFFQFLSTAEFASER